MFVRPAQLVEAEVCAQLQQEAWAARYALLLPPEVLGATAPAVEGWHDLVAAGANWPDGRALVLVAVSDGVVVGVLAAVPATDPDLSDAPWLEIVELAVANEHIGAGHGSRLLAAWADICQAAGDIDGGVMWVASDDDELRGLLGAAGFAADGAHRTLDLHGDGTVTVRMVRLATALHDHSTPE